MIAMIDPGFRKYFWLLGAVIVLVALSPTSTIAQREYHVSVNGNDANSGTAKKPLKSISAATVKAKAGDIITVHEGIYRELIQPSVGGLSNESRIIYQAAVGDNVEIKGSEVVKDWVSIGNSRWRVSLPSTYFGNYNPYKDLVFGDWFFPGRNKVHTGEVYLNRQPLGEVAKAETPMSWSTESKGDSTVIFAHFGEADPNKELVEINVRPACFYPPKTGVNYITVRGFHMSQAATQWAAPTAEQIGLIGTNWSKGWIIEDCVISDSKCVGITLGKDHASGHNLWSKDMSIDGSVHYNQVVKNVLADGWSIDKIGSHVVRRNTIFRCGQAGVCGSFGAAFSEISDNSIYDIYTYRKFWGAEMAGIKLHAGIDAVIKGNKIRNTNIGIWIDWMAQGTEISENVCYENDYVDFFSEVNHGPYLVADNYFLSPFSVKDWAEGGAYISNYFAGLLSFSPQDRITPYFQPNSTKLVGLEPIIGGDNYFYNNIFCGNEGKKFSAMPNASIPGDGIDPNSGYGLAHYGKAVQPVFAGGNVYLEGAVPLSTEVGYTTVKRLNDINWSTWKGIRIAGEVIPKTLLSKQEWNFQQSLNQRKFAGPKWQNELISGLLNYSRN